MSTKLKLEPTVPHLRLINDTSFNCLLIAGSILLLLKYLHYYRLNNILLQTYIYKLLFYLFLAVCHLPSCEPLIGRKTMLSHSSVMLVVYTHPTRST